MPGYSDAYSVAGNIGVIFAVGCTRYNRLIFTHPVIMLSNKAKYALRAAAYLAGHYNGAPVQIAEVAEAKKIPLKFLESILLQLKKAGYLESKKGKGGGYFLKKAPDAISLAMIIRTIDGPIAMLPCVSLNFYQECTDCEKTTCGLNRTIAEARDATLAVLEHRFLSDII